MRIAWNDRTSTAGSERAGSFHRSLSLPASVVADSAKAEFEDGVLELRLPKVPEIRPKTIEVKAKSKA